MLIYREIDFGVQFAVDMEAKQVAEIFHITEWQVGPGY